MGVEACSVRYFLQKQVKLEFQIFCSYEVTSCQAPFFVIGHITQSLIFVVDRAGGFLVREASLCFE
jgi:hypothetical protein